jgi:hypothetical protein
MKRRLALAAALLTVAVPLAFALAPEETVDWGMMTRIRDEGFSNSKVMDTLWILTEKIGPRLTGSPQMKAANEWTRKQLEDWGMANAHLESYGPFGRGWSYEHVAVHMVAPQQKPLIAYPVAWTPGTGGPVRAKATKLKLETEADLEKVKGKLAGTVVLLADARDLAPPDKAYFTRYTNQELDDIETFQIPGQRRPGAPGGPGGQPFDREAMTRRQRFQRTLREFLKAEKVVATLMPSDREGAVVRLGGGGSRQANEDPGVLGLVMAAEHYNQVARMLDRQLEVELEVDVKTTFHDADPMAYNTVAEIPGTDKKAEIVMVGGHLDSWHPGTGTNDNAAGSAVAMEALRILKALEVKPRRTIRIGLWSGEEQGLLGSRAYVKEHFAARPDPPQTAENRDMPEFMRRATGPLTVKPEHAKFAAYFNLDNGTGKIRGIYTQQSAAAAPIFEAWLKPFHDTGATRVTMRNTGGTDHQSFDGVGLPGFQFIQDPADYGTRTHHTNMDVYDRAQREDLMQASVIMAAFAYNAAMREELFPRKPMPKDPPGTPGASPSPAPSPAAGKAAAKPQPKPSPAPKQ